MKRLSLRQLEVFRAIMRTGSLTAASNGLGISQPAASRLLGHAERQLGLTLFDRSNNRLRPTPEARVLYPDVDRLLADLDYVERMADDLQRLKTGRLRIATITSLALTVVAEAVASFSKAFPSVSVQVETALNFDVPDIVLNRGVDFGLAFLPLPTDELWVEEIRRTDIVAVVPRDHPLARRDILTTPELRDEPLISFKRALPIGAYVANAFEAAGVSPPISIEVGHSFLACSLVRAGAGIALVDSLAEDSVMFPELRFIPVKPAIPISAVLLAAENRTPSLVADAFRGILRDVAGNQIAPHLAR